MGDDKPDEVRALPNHSLDFSRARSPSRCSESAAMEHETDTNKPLRSLKHASVCHCEGLMKWR